jgi:hypothetical protein
MALVAANFEASSSQSQRETQVSLTIILRCFEFEDFRKSSEIFVNKVEMILGGYFDPEKFNSPGTASKE